MPGSSGPIEPILAGLEAQRHRRFVKSHLAADGLRFFPEAKYIVVGRDTRDVFMSLFNHYSAYTDLMYAIFNDAARPGSELPRCPATPRELWPRWIGEGWFEWEPDGWPFWSHHHHLSTWWAVRDLPNVLFVHFGDLKADPEAEMRRIAAFCDIDVAEERWPALAARRSGSTRCATEARGDATTRWRIVFEGGAARFFYKGDNGRWRDGAHRRRPRAVRRGRRDARSRRSGSGSRAAATPCARRRRPRPEPDPGGRRPEWGVPRPRPDEEQLMGAVVLVVRATTGPSLAGAHGRRVAPRHRLRRRAWRASAPARRTASAYDRILDRR